MARTKQNKQRRTGKHPRKALAARRSSGAAAAAPTPSKRRYRPGQKALREIREYQRSTTLLLRKLPFSRLVRGAKPASAPLAPAHGRAAQVREVTAMFSNTVTRWQADALQALQSAAEGYLVHLFEDA